MSTSVDFGILYEGFRAKRLTDIQSELEEAILNTIDPRLNLQADSAIGQLVGIIAAQLAELWAAQEAGYAVLDPLTATGRALDFLLALTGLTRNSATYTTVNLQVTLNAGVLLPALSRARNSVSGEVFETQVSISNAAPSTAVLDVQATAINEGAVLANAGDIDIIDVPVAGWTAVYNPLDGVLGSLDETDESARIRRVQNLSGAGSSTVEAIKATLAGVLDVTAVLVIENESDITDAQGLPPHSVEAIVVGGADQDIADALWYRGGKAGGIQTHGGVTVVTTDSMGLNHSMLFSRPANLLMYIDMDVTVDPITFGGGVQSIGDAELRAALTSRGNSLLIGEDIQIVDFECVARRQAGVTNAGSPTTTKIDSITPPVNPNDIVVAFRDIAKFDASRIVITYV